MTNQAMRHLDDKIIRIKARFALLHVLGERRAHANAVKAEETYRPTADLVGLTSREQAITIREKNGAGEDRPWWPNQVQWARQKLKDVGALESGGHGYWRLTDKGRKQYELLVTQLGASDKSFEEFVEDFVARKRAN